MILPNGALCVTPLALCSSLARQAEACCALRNNGWCSRRGEARLRLAGSPAPRASDVHPPPQRSYATQLEGISQHQGGDYEFGGLSGLRAWWMSGVRLGPGATALTGILLIGKQLRQPGR
jgi:hypothetical protein